MSETRKVPEQKEFPTKNYLIWISKKPASNNNSDRVIFKNFSFRQEKIPSKNQWFQKNEKTNVECTPVEKKYRDKKKT